MFETSGEEEQEMMRTTGSANSLAMSSVDSSKRSFIDISDGGSEAEVNELNVASQSLELPKRRKTVITRQLFQQGDKERLVPERLIKIIIIMIIKITVTIIMIFKHVF